MKRLVLLLGGLLLASTACLAGIVFLLLAEAPALPIATVDFLDVGQGDAILIRSPEGKTVLIDAGPSKGIVKLLRERDVTGIDLAVITHHHIDHYGGMDDVIREFHPETILLTDSPHTTRAYLGLLELIEAEGIVTVFATGKSRKVEAGSVLLTVLPMPPVDSSEENNNSVGLRVEHGESSMLLTGDSQEAERNFWAGTCPPLVHDCDVLKLAHHGSRNGTDEFWLKLVHPKLAVISCGAGNSYGHPSQQVLRVAGELGREPVHHGAASPSTQTVKPPRPISDRFATKPNCFVILKTQLFGCQVLTAFTWGSS
ncbi:ComEC/Rec2 family competence protein [Singulisphaera acidiphila]|uniref:Putative hydrolase (Metallo-beta-lactamase superfamily) n=1 Tax=Singulisphaera acidiphila (strain ATCC BAA-1392 / DSM 18658 / VKM B-2454 / MOB10) TaxID=886293 RepID=L0DCX1_SINAD|nr:MBL fold metallo-hydrolase [Singulisphaera acidiphila]AGA26491.1 putative hydrolase (metallo-beta-lactamase superfamily) [Singulisphaera acidiphila DSM 18658]